MLGFLVEKLPATIEQHISMRRRECRKICGVSEEELSVLLEEELVFVELAFKLFPCSGFNSETFILFILET